MAIKIVQTVNPVSATAGTGTTSNVIALRSGYLRVSTANTAAHVEIGFNPITTNASFHVPPYSSEIIKHRIARQRFSGITTGATTTISFGENNGNLFAVGDYVAIEGLSPAGINTNFAQVTVSNGESITVAYNTTSVAAGDIAIGNGIVTLAVKVGVMGQGGTTSVSICEVTQLVNE
jgi:hypothetical protein